jgi:carbonic anhydrase/acetyltransferase-like protein (isoleucine patch superfamily)
MGGARVRLCAMLKAKNLLGPESAWRAIGNRLLQVLANYAPGATTVRVRLHKLRGVTIGENTFIGTDALIETSHPELVTIGSDVALGIRSVIIAHFRGPVPTNGESVRIEDEVFVGPCAIILPNVTIGRGAVVTAGSVVTKSVPPLTMVQGNPATPVAICGVPLGRRTSLTEFYAKLKPVRRAVKEAT